jgi:hypothetical protein
MVDLSWRLVSFKQRLRGAPPQPKDGKRPPSELAQPVAERNVDASSESAAKSSDEAIPPPVSAHLKDEPKTGGISVLTFSGEARCGGFRPRGSRRGDATRSPSVIKIVEHPPLNPVEIRGYRPINVTDQVNVSFKVDFANLND